MDYIVQNIKGLLFWCGDIKLTHADKDYSIIASASIVSLLGEQNQLTLIKIIEFLLQLLLFSINC